MNETSAFSLPPSLLSLQQQLLTILYRTAGSLADTGRRLAGSLGQGIDVEKIAEEIFALKDILLDKTFKIGIIGEFSCGKTTFINAFLESRSLVEDILPGTTCASTVIGYSDREQIRLRYTNGQNRVFDCAQGYSHQALQAFLQSSTAVEGVAEHITEVEWRSPIPVLREGFVLVDTPGIGSLNPRHTDVARTAAEKCDALLVLINLQTGQFSRDIVDAVRAIAGKSATKCIFVGTHLDILQVKEHVRMDNFFRKKIASCFGASSPYFLVSALEALEELGSSKDGATRTGCTGAAPHTALEKFRTFRRELHALLCKRCLCLRFHRVAARASSLLLALQARLETRQVLLEKELATYQKPGNNGDFRQHDASRLHSNFVPYTIPHTQQAHACHDSADEKTVRTKQRLAEIHYACVALASAVQELNRLDEALIQETSKGAL